jgi:hypothetical protein
VIEYDFDPRFWNPIASGEKRGTIRRMRTKPRRHARPDEAIELWALVDGRRLQIRKAACATVEGVFMHLERGIFRLGPIFKNRSTWPDLDAGGREGLARLTGHPGGWKEAAEYYAAVYGEGPETLCLVTWRDRDYDGPIPTVPQLRDLRILVDAGVLIPAYGKISVQVGFSLLLLKWAEVTDPAKVYFKNDERGHVPIRPTELGRWILDKFEK